MNNIKFVSKVKTVLKSDNAKLNFSFLGILIFSILFICILSKVELYADDFFYITFFDNGFKGFIQNNINHYNEVNGRAFVHLLAEFFLNAKQFIFILFIFLCLGYIFYFGISFLLPKQISNQNKLISICISANLLFCISVFVLKETTFWITGAMNYIVPTVFCCLALSTINNILKSNKIKLIHILILFLSGATTEQGFLLTLFYTISYFIFYVIDNKKFSKNFLTILLAELSGFLTIFLSPASRNRIDIGNNIFNTPIFQLIRENFASFSSRIVGENSIFLIISLLILSIAFLSLKDKKLGNSLSIGFLISGGLIILNLFKIYNESLSITLTILIVIYIILSIIKCGKIPDYRNISILLTSALLIQAATFALGENSYRIFWMLAILCDIISANIITIILIKYNSEKINSIVLGFIILLGTIIGITIFKGYNYNQNIFNSMKESIKNYNQNRFIEINININEKYAHTMGYANAAFFDYFLQNYNIKDIEDDIYFIKDEQSQIYVNGILLKYPAFFENNTTYVPVRYVIEALNGTCEWTKENTKYTCGDYIAIVDNFSNKIIYSTLEKNTNYNLQNSQKTFLGRTYIDLEKLNYIVGESKNKVIIGS